MIEIHGKSRSRPRNPRIGQQRKILPVAAGLVLFILVVIFPSCSRSESESGAVEISPAIPPAIESSATIAADLTLENYNKLETDMSYQEVARILGSDGTVSRFAEVNGFKLVSYRWKGDNLKRIFCTFRNDKLTKKSESGLGL